MRYRAALRPDVEKLDAAFGSGNLELDREVLEKTRALHPHPGSLQRPPQWPPERRGTMERRSSYPVFWRGSLVADMLVIYEL